jgi:hypothetical protein
VLPIPTSALDGSSNLVPPSGVANTALNAALPSGQVLAATILPSQVTTAFTLVTTTTYVMGILLPRNLAISQVRTFSISAGTTTGYWVGVADQGAIVRAVSANAAAGPTGSPSYFAQSVTPGNNLAYVTPYTGLYYLFVGVVTSAAGTNGATAAMTNAAVNAGPPVIAGTAALVATTTPPLVGSSLGALTGTVGGVQYMDIV